MVRPPTVVSHWEWLILVEFDSYPMMIRMALMQFHLLLTFWGHSRLWRRVAEENQDEDFDNTAATTYIVDEEDDQEDIIKLCVTGPKTLTNYLNSDPHHPTLGCGPTSFCYLQPTTNHAICSNTQQPSYDRICISKPTICVRKSMYQYVVVMGWYRCLGRQFVAVF